MGKPNPSSPTRLLILYLTLTALTPPPPSASAVSYTQLRHLLSLTHSLSTRVAHLRASRGDHAGARRAQVIADKLRFGYGFSFWRTVWSFGWDYVKNYAWRDTMSFWDAAEFKELVRAVVELARMGSDAERVAWVARNYSTLLRLGNGVFSRLLSVFTKPGPVREMVEILQAEMVEGAILRDCLEVGAKDFQGLVRILKDLGSQYATSPHEEL